MLSLDASNPQAAQHGPLNQYSGWVYGLLLFVLLFGFTYTLPNMFGKDSAVQISGVRSFELTEGDLNKAKQLLAENNIVLKDAEFTDDFILLRMRDPEKQLAAKELLAEAFEKNKYSVAPNLVSAAPDWLKGLGADVMNLGLDLRGGIEFLMEVDMDSALKTRNEQTEIAIKTELRDKKVRGAVVRQNANGDVNVRFRDESRRDEAYDVLRARFNNELNISTSEAGKYFLINTQLKESVLKETRDYAIRQNITTLRNRVNELGVAEPLIQREGADRIVVQLPGVQDSAGAREILGRAASLEFRPLYEDKTNTALQKALNGQRIPGAELLYNRAGRPYLLKKDVIVSGENIIGATSSRDEDGQPQVNVSLDSKGGERMGAFTRKNLHKMMASVYIEYITDEVEIDGVMQKQQRVERHVINAAVIQGVFKDRFQITGLDSPKEASTLALELRSGALSAPIHIIKENLVGPSLGKENIEKGLLSIQVGFIAVIIFMILYYRVFGLIAAAALVTNLLLIVSLMSLLGATLTLPGMAGIVLTVGMAVDANVLIFERIREELKDGTPVQQAIHSGYDKALSTIADANVTTLVAAIVLLAFGTGPIKGFAITLAVGILTSMLTAIVGSRAIVNAVYGGKPKAKLSI